MSNSRSDRHARLTALLALIGNWAVIVFCVGLVLLLAIPLMNGNRDGWLLIVVVLVLSVTVTAGLVFICALVLRAAVAERWRFSLLGVMVTTTVFAILLGLVAMLRGS